MVRRIMTTSLFFIFEGQSFRLLRRTWRQPSAAGGVLPSSRFAGIDQEGIGEA